MRKGGQFGSWTLNRARAYIDKIMDPKTQSIEKTRNGYVFTDLYNGNKYLGDSPKQAIRKAFPLAMTSPSYEYGIN